MDIDTAEAISQGQPHQRTLTCKCPHIYFRLHLFFPDAPQEISSNILRDVIQHGLQQLYGFVGGAINFEVLTMQSTTGIGIVKTNKSDYQKFRAAVSLISEYQNQAAIVEVVAASPFLLSFSINSRSVGSSVPMPG